MPLRTYKRQGREIRIVCLRIVSGFNCQRLLLAAVIFACNDPVIPLAISLSTPKTSVSSVIGLARRWESF